MPGSEFFRRLGLFVVDRFLDSAECARVCADMDTAGAESAGVTDSSGQDYMVDEDFRRAKMANVPKSIRSLVRSRLQGLRPQIAQHFRTTLTGCEVPQFLAYDAGSFFRGPQ